MDKLSEKEIAIHDRFDSIDYENLTKGERARLHHALVTLEIILDRIETGYYKEMKQSLESD